MNTISADDLAILDLFRHLNDADRARWAVQCEPRSLDPSGVLYHEGDEIDAVYGVLAGTVVAYREAVAMPVQLVGRYGPGRLVGHVDLFADGPHLSAVRATEASRLVAFGREVFEALLDEHPDLFARLEVEVTERYGAQLAAALDLERHREVRMRVSHAAELELPGGSRRPVQLENLSVGGFCMRDAPTSWDENDEVRFKLHVPGGALDLGGRVAWRRDEAVGLAFDRMSNAHDTLIQMAIHLLVADHLD
ncbi:MAG: cyclic nucleotide-binding domain-containing protein [Acidobacteriota bacterium]